MVNLQVVKSADRSYVFLGTSNRNGGIPIRNIKVNYSVIVSFKAEVSYLSKPPVITNVENVSYYTFMIMKHLLHQLESLLVVVL